MKKKLFLALISILLFVSCLEDTKVVTENDKTPETKNRIIAAPLKDDAILEKGVEKNTDVFKLEDKIYSIEEFYKIFIEHSTNLIDQEVILQGYYQNHNKQRAKGEEEYELNVTLYSTVNMDNEKPKAFFIMQSDNSKIFKNIKQGDQITIKGIIQRGDFFGAPLLHKGEIIR